MSDATGFTLFIFLFVLMAFIGILPIAGKWKVITSRFAVRRLSRAPLLVSR